MSLDAFTAADGGVQFWHPVTDEEIDESFLPWGPVAAGSSADTRLRVHNTSDTYTAVAVELATAGPVDAGTRDASGQHLLSVDGDVFAATVTIGDLPPRSVSAPVWLRRITPAGAPAGAAGFRVTATAAGWRPAGTPTVGSVADGFDPGSAPPPVQNLEDMM